MDGYELAEAAIALNPDIKMLMLTGYPEMRIPPPALQAREIRTGSEADHIDLWINLIYMDHNDLPHRLSRSFPWRSSVGACPRTRDSERPNCRS